MSTRETVTITTKEDRLKIARWAHQTSEGTVVTFRKKSRSTEQSAKMWAMLHEVADQVEWYGQKIDAEDWKDMFTASLRHARVVPGIDKGTFVPLGMHTSTMTIEEMTNLIELIYAFGADPEHPVVFKESSTPEEAKKALQRIQNREEGKTGSYAADYFRDVVLPYDGDDCLLWPYSRSHDGYGLLWWDGKSSRISRITCTLLEGEAPSHRHEAAHSCGKGHEGCVNPKHVRWASKDENEVDKQNHGRIRRGENHPSSRLTDAQVVEIRALAGKETAAETAARFGCKINHVYDIQKGKRRRFATAGDAARSPAAAGEDSDPPPPGSSPAASLTEADLGWLKTVTTMLWAATHPGKHNLSILENQKMCVPNGKAFSPAAREKAHRIYEQLEKVPMLGHSKESKRGIIANIAGINPKELPDG